MADDHVSRCLKSLQVPSLGGLVFWVSPPARNSCQVLGLLGPLVSAVHSVVCQSWFYLAFHSLLHCHSLLFFLGSGSQPILHQNLSLRNRSISYIQCTVILSLRHLISLYVLIVFKTMRYNLDTQKCIQYMPVV